MAETQSYAVPDLTLATTYTNPAMLPDMGVQQTQLDQLFSQNPVSMPVNDVISAIQSQYQPVDLNYGEGPYGAARFIGSPVTSGNVGTTVNTLPTWFQPGAFDINAYNVTPSEQLSNQIATGELYGGSSPVNVATSSINSPNDPYASWGQTAPNALKAALNMMIPGAGLMIGAGQGYNQTQLGNTIGTGLAAYGGQTNQVSPTLGAVLGTLGISNPSSNLANMMGKNFSSAETMYGYMDAASNPMVSQITEALLANAGTKSAVTPEMVGVIGYSVGSQIQSLIGDGMSIQDATAMTAMNMGIPQSEAEAYGVSAAQASVASALQSGTPLSELNPADVAAYNDQIGALIDALGINTAIQQAVSPVADQISAQNQAIAQLANNYEQLGISQQDALNLAMSDISTQLSDQAQQIADLTAAYEAVGMNTVDATNQAIADTAPSQNVGDVYGPDNIDVGGGWSPADTGGSYGGVDNTGAAMSASDADVAYGSDQYGGYETQSSGDSGGGGGKIVCTAMNEAYGFGSFRNQIWLKYSADRLTKAHEVGYHALFLPLVDIGYKKDVKVVRKALEHIARHRTADIRAEMRGTKRDNLGRMYRFVLEPLCYVVGKLKGY